MVFLHVQNPYALFRVIGQCEGRVRYLSDGGEACDLKPVARQLLASQAIFQAAEIPRLEILADSARDQQRLMRFMQDVNYCDGTVAC